MNIERYAALIKGWPPEMGMIIGERSADDSISYAWIGGPVIQLSQESLYSLNYRSIGKKFAVVGPYYLRPLTIWGTDIIAVRIGPLSFAEQLLVGKFLFKRWLKSLNRKILKTLVVWEVLSYEPGAIAQWRDLFRRKKADDSEEVT